MGLKRSIFSFYFLYFSQVRVASFAALEKIATLLDKLSRSGLAEILKRHSATGRRGTVVEDYESFITQFVRALLATYPQRAEAYVTTVQHLCSPGAAPPNTQSDAALLLAQVVVRAPESAKNRIALLTVVKSITDLCSSENQLVRSRAAHALGIFASNLSQ